MENLLEVIKIIVPKYIENFNIIVTKDELTLEYLQYINGEKDVYTSLTVEEFEDKFKVTFMLEKIIRIVDLKELKEIIIAMQKQRQTKQFSQAEVKALKEKYKTGAKVELIKMYDTFNNVPEGTRGIIKGVDDLGTIQVSWENGTTLGLIVGVDEFKIIQ